MNKENILIGKNVVDLQIKALKKLRNHINESFNNAVNAIFKCKSKVIICGLAGVGDLYVSAIGGRNSKMGEYLGKGYKYKNAKIKFMKNDTIEAADLAYEISAFIEKRNPKWRNK